MGIYNYRIYGDKMEIEWEFATILWEYNGDKMGIYNYCMEYNGNRMGIYILYQTNVHYNRITVWPWSSPLAMEFENC